MVAAAFALLLMTAIPAHADPELNQMSPEACQETQASSTFKFAIYYNSNYAGAYRNIGYSVYDFGDERVGGSPQGGLQPLNFCHGGAGNGQGIKNNAASVKNKHATYWAIVYYNSGFKGTSEAISRQANLTTTKNNNASFEWYS
ncbi:hypothetical protein [Streptomyces liangshanensis]|uniref:hypothetical protein n=1 Tax=Streptomyces liangshanensis TaxID=2717324 RepID=UPI0036DA8902